MNEKLLYLVVAVVAWKLWSDSEARKAQLALAEQAMANKERGEQREAQWWSNAFGLGGAVATAAGDLAEFGSGLVALVGGGVSAASGSSTQAAAAPEEEA